MMVSRVVSTGARIRAFVLVCAVFVAWLLMAAAAVGAESRPAVPGVVIDEVDVLTSGQEAELQRVFDQWGTEVQAQIGVVFIDDVRGQAPAEVADDWFDGKHMGVGAGRDGVMLLVAVHSRDMHILLNGQPYRLLPRSVVEDLSDRAGSRFAAGDWPGGADVFGRGIGQALLDEANRVRVFGRDPMSLGMAAAGGAGGGVMVMAAGEAASRKRMRNVGVATRARQYVVPASAVILAHEDVLYNQDVSRVYIPPKSDDSSSSSGSWSGGGSRGGYTSSF